MTLFSNYQRSRPYSDDELCEAIMVYLKDKFLFRKLEIDQWLGDEQVIYKRREGVNQMDKCAEEMWHDGEFDDWKVCTSVTVKNICSEFIFKNNRAVGKNRKTYIRNIIQSEVRHGELIESIKFNPILKRLIDNGRKQVRKINPLPNGSPQRVNVQLNEGEICYFCWNAKNPYVANPAYVFSKGENSYKIIFFSNQNSGSETSKLEINMGRFMNVPANELGLTPEQAVLQRFC